MLLKNWLNQLEEISLALCWCHWNRLGALGVGPINRCSTDPETLLVISAILGAKDLRLKEVMSQWIENYESLISIDRLKNLFNKFQKEYPLKTKAALFLLLEDILKKSLPHAKLTRWRKFLIDTTVKKNTEQIIKNRKKLQNHQWILKYNIQLSLRYLLGPGSRADILYFALVLRNQKGNPFNLAITPIQLAQRLCYNPSTIYRTLSDFEEGALFVEISKKSNLSIKTYKLNQDYSLLMTKVNNVAKWNSKKISERQDIYFIDWFAVLEIIFCIVQLVESLKKVKHQGIIKNRIFEFNNKVEWLLRKACVEVKFKKNSQGALKDVLQNDLMKTALDQCQQMLQIITGNYP